MTDARSKGLAVIQPDGTSRAVDKPQDRRKIWLNPPLTSSCEDTPFPGNTFERMDATVAEAQPGAGHQILYGARYQDLAGAGERRYACADVNGNSADIVADHFALACVKSGPEFDAERLDLLRNGAGTANAARRTVKCGEEAVARHLDFMASEAREISTDHRMMMIENISPALVAKHCSLLCRSNDVGE